MRRKVIYIASPYSNGDKKEMVRVQIDAFNALRDLGYTPIAPLLSHFINEVKPRDWKDWLDYDFDLISLSDIVVRIRLKGNNGVEIYSTGADLEEKEARRLGREYYEFNGVDEMREFFEKLYSKLDNLIE